MSDKKQTAAPLGHSEELRVQYSPCETIPEFIHLSEQLSESVHILACERSRYVLPQKPARTKLLNASNVLEHEAGRAFEPFSLSCDGE